MKYRDFENKVKSLGDSYSVSYDNVAVIVYYQGNWVATIFKDTLLDYNMQRSWSGYWGSEQQRVLCIRYCHELANTLPKNRGVYGKKIERVVG